MQLLQWIGSLKGVGYGLIIQSEGMLQNLSVVTKYLLYDYVYIDNDGQYRLTESRKKQ